MVKCLVIASNRAPQLYGFLKDVVLLLINKLRKQAVDDNQQFDLVLLAQLPNQLDQCVLETEVERAATFLDELLWI